LGYVLYSQLVHLVGYVSHHEDCQNSSYARGILNRSVSVIAPPAWAGMVSTRSSVAPVRSVRQRDPSCSGRGNEAFTLVDEAIAVAWS
jgi:hypothetical protein